MPELAAQSNADCLSCHGEHSLSTTRKGKNVSLFVEPGVFDASAHAGLQCVDCHKGLDPADIPHAKKIARVRCISCHDGEQFLNHSRSVHGTPPRGDRPAADCVDCHTAHAVRVLAGTDEAGRKQWSVQVCGTCHAGVEGKYMASDHGRALAGGIKGAPSCIDCHGEHDVLPAADSVSQTNRRKQDQLCLRCHLDNEEVRARVGPSVAFISSFESSVHAHAARDGSGQAATCSDCHSSHEVRKGSDPASRVAKENISATCGRCHADVLQQYASSIHGEALAKGITAAPSCTDCHGEHNILSPKDVRSPVSARNVSLQVCSPCHASVKLTQKFGLSSDRFQSFADSYHGLAGKAGDVEVANCASCHGVHDIRPSSDPRSRISKENLARTCGACHPGANANFTRGEVHVVASSGKEDLLYFISSGYVVLIIVVIGAMALHNILDFLRKSRRKMMERRGALHREPVGHRLYLRMSLNERLQHGTLLISFAALVFTGFALKFPDAWWVAPVRNLSSWMFDLRGIVHRTAAVVLVLAGLYHLYYLFAVPRGKRLLRDLLPVRRDIRDAVGVMKYNLGLQKEKPKLGRFSYVEKSEYWALVWGTIVMALTGMILWFDNTFLGLLTKLWWDAARTVHYYEAWLATLAIIVWHFYFIIFNPDIYPINLAFWKGTITEEEMREEHPLELDALTQKEVVEEVSKPEKKKEEVVP